MTFQRWGILMVGLLSGALMGFRHGDLTLNEEVVTSAQMANSNKPMDQDGIFDEADSKDSEAVDHPMPSNEQDSPAELELLNLSAAPLGVQLSWVRGQKAMIGFKLDQLMKFSQSHFPETYFISPQSPYRKSKWQAGYTDPVEYKNQIGQKMYVKFEYDGRLAFREMASRKSAHILSFGSHALTMSFFEEEQWLPKTFYNSLSQAHRLENGLYYAAFFPSVLSSDRDHGARFYLPLPQPDGPSDQTLELKIFLDTQGERCITVPVQWHSLQTES